MIVIAQNVKLAREQEAIEVQVQVEQEGKREPTEVRVTLLSTEPATGRAAKEK
jgi:hypothetical protein